MTQYHRRSTEIPFISKPAHKENEAVEQLTAPLHVHDPRPEMVKPYENVAIPRYNKLYGTLRVEDGWKEIIDNYANGTITTVAGALATATVTLAQKYQETRLSRWPGGVQLYLALRAFSMAPSTATFTTLGSVDVYYQDLIGGQIIPLGNAQSNGEFNMEGITLLIPTPITDAGALANPIGQLQANLSAAATVGTYVWQLAYSYAYLLPAQKPYEVQHVEELLDGHPGHARIAHK